VAPECIADRDQQMAYLGNIRMVFLTTVQTFNQQEFGEAAIKQESRIFSQQVD